MGIHKEIMKISFIILLSLLVCSISTLQQQDLDKISRYIRNNGKLQELSTLISIGSMGGYFKIEEVWQLHAYLQKQFPNLISPATSIGKSYQKRDILSFKVGDNINNANRPKKTAILFDALHHSREMTSLSVLITAFIENLKNLYHQSRARRGLLVDQLDLIFIPVVNVDSVKQIGDSYGTSKWHVTRNIRKNRNLENGCADPIRAGVDLNRNYGFKYAIYKQHGSSSDPCQSDYRGPHAWSEPETRAMKHFIETHPEIKSALNFHAYGDLLIRPFTFEREQSQHLLRNYPRFYNVYEEFKKTAPHRKKTLFGKAMNTIHYSANGEASDWMFAKHKILAMSPEVGIDDQWAQGFYIPNVKLHLPKLISGFYPTIDHLIKMHDTNIKFVNQTVNASGMTIKLFNYGLVDLHNVNSLFKVTSRTNKVRSVSISYMNEDHKNRLTRSKPMRISSETNSASLTSNLERRIGIIIQVTFESTLASGARPSWEFSLSRKRINFARITHTSRRKMQRPRFQQ